MWQFVYQWADSHLHSSRMCGKISISVVSLPEAPPTELCECWMCTQLTFIWTYSTFNNSHKAALRISGGRFRSLMHKPEAAVARKNSLRWHEEGTLRKTRHQCEHYSVQMEKTKIKQFSVCWKRVQCEQAVKKRSVSFWLLFFVQNLQRSGEIMRCDLLIGFTLLLDSKRVWALGNLCLLNILNEQQIIEKLSNFPVGVGSYCPSWVTEMNW